MMTILYVTMFLYICHHCPYFHLIFTKSYCSPYNMYLDTHKVAFCNHDCWILWYMDFGWITFSFLRVVINTHVTIKADYRLCVILWLSYGFGPDDSELNDMRQRRCELTDCNNLPLQVECSSQRPEVLSRVYQRVGNPQGVSESLHNLPCTLDLSCVNTWRKIFHIYDNLYP